MGKQPGDIDASLGEENNEDARLFGRPLVEFHIPCEQMQVLWKAFRGQYGIDEANLSRSLTGKKLKEYAARLYREKVGMGCHE